MSRANLHIIAYILFASVSPRVDAESRWFDFGEGIAVCGDTLLITDPRRGYHDNTKPSTVWKYSRTSTNSPWQPAGVLPISQSPGPGWVGRQIACTNTTLAITDETGSARYLLVYASSSGAFQKVGSVELPTHGIFAPGNGNHSIAIMDESILVTTEPVEQGPSMVHVIRRSNNKWAIVQTLKNGTQEHFGQNIEALGKLVFISHSKLLSRPTDRGVVAFRRSSSKFVQKFELTGNVASFGSRLAASTDLLLISSQLANDGESKFVSVYRSNDSDVDWLQNITPYRDSSFPLSNDFANQCLAVSNDWIAIGGQFRSTSGQVAGLVDIYYKSDVGGFVHGFRFKLPDTANNSSEVANCAFSGAERLVITAYNSQADDGVAYVVARKSASPTDWAIESTFRRGQ